MHIEKTLRLLATAAILLGGLSAGAVPPTQQELQQAFTRLARARTAFVRANGLAQGKEQTEKWEAKRAGQSRGERRLADLKEFLIEVSGVGHVEVLGLGKQTTVGRCLNEHLVGGDYSPHNNSKKRGAREEVRDDILHLVGCIGHYGGKSDPVYKGAQAAFDKMIEATVAALDLVNRP